MSGLTGCIYSSIILANMVGIEARTILQQKPEGKSIKPLEVEKKIFQFKPEAKVGLKQLGRVVIPLTGESIVSLRKKGVKLQSDWHKDYTEFEAQCSITSEVAINPKEIFLAESNNKPFSVQKEMAELHSKKVSEEVDGVKAIIGKPIDNLELITKVYELYGGENGIGDLLRKVSARCAGKSPILNIYNSVDGFGVTVGNMDSEGKALITGRASRPSEKVYVIAMEVPEDLPVLVEKPVQGEEPAK